jgi:hypothetical protein
MTAMPQKMLALFSGISPQQNAMAYRRFSQTCEAQSKFSKKVVFGVLVAKMTVAIVNLKEASGCRPSLN